MELRKTSFRKTSCTTDLTTWVNRRGNKTNADKKQWNEIKINWNKIKERIITHNMTYKSDIEKAITSNWNIYSVLHSCLLILIHSFIHHLNSEIYFSVNSKHFRVILISQFELLVWLGIFNSCVNLLFKRLILFIY